jgi:hypothetical protein
VDTLQVPAPLRDKLGDSASEGLVMMFADAHKLAAESFERRLELETAKFHLAIANLRFDVLKWLFLFWVSQLAASVSILIALLK